MNREELKAEIVAQKKIKDSRWAKGWERGKERNVHMNDHIAREAAEGHRVDPAPRLDQLDGDRDPME